MTSPLMTKKDASILDEYAEIMAELNDEEDEDYSWAVNHKRDDEEEGW